jgi:hypothetical protein
VALWLPCQFLRCLLGCLRGDLCTPWGVGLGVGGMGIYICVFIVVYIYIYIYNIIYISLSRVV